MLISAARSRSAGSSSHPDSGTSAAEACVLPEASPAPRRRGPVGVGVGPRRPAGFARVDLEVVVVAARRTLPEPLRSVVVLDQAPDPTGRGPRPPRSAVSTRAGGGRAGGRGSRRRRVRRRTRAGPTSDDAPAAVGRLPDDRPTRGPRRASSEPRNLLVFGRGGALALAEALLEGAAELGDQRLPLLDGRRFSVSALRAQAGA